MMIAVHLGTELVEIEMESDLMLEGFCQRIEDMTHEKLATLDELDAVTAENIKLRGELAEAGRQLAMMRGFG